MAEKANMRWTREFVEKWQKRQTCAGHMFEEKWRKKQTCAGHVFEEKRGKVKHAHNTCL
jgi:hypothetical protein